MHDPAQQTYQRALEALSYGEGAYIESAPQWHVFNDPDTEEYVASYGWAHAAGLTYSHRQVEYVATVMNGVDIGLRAAWNAPGEEGT